MKKYVLIILLFLLVGCKNDLPPKVEKDIEAITSKIDKSLVNEITGTWFENRREYTISYDESYLTFDEKKLVIETTDNNTIATHLFEDQKSTYHFSLEKDKLTVAPSYRTEFDPKNPASGGDFAPIHLERKAAIEIEEIYGSWKSTEADYPVEIMIKPTFHNKTILLLEKSNQNQENYTETEVTLLEKTDTLLSFLTKDKSLEYKISFLEDGNMLMVPFSRSQKDDSTPNVFRPYSLIKDN